VRAGLTGPSPADSGPQTGLVDLLRQVSQPLSWVAQGWASREEYQRT
jgi:hypothetical protein